MHWNVENMHLHAQQFPKEIYLKNAEKTNSFLFLLIYILIIIIRRVFRASLSFPMLIFFSKLYYPRQTSTVTQKRENPPNPGTYRSCKCEIEISSTYTKRAPETPEILQKYDLSGRNTEIIQIHVALLLNPAFFFFFSITIFAKRTRISVGKLQFYAFLRVHPRSDVNV